MLTIHKFKIQATIPMPKHARILSVGAQYGIMVLWAQVDTEEPMVARRIDIVATGQEYRCDEKLIGRVDIEGLVFHIFDGG